MKQAVAVLITRGRRILAFQRYNEKGLSLPCGKVRVGETPEEAACRKTREETGHTVSLMGDPFVGFDIDGGYLVQTYRAEIVDGSLSEATTTAGVAMWASPRELVNGPFKHYNIRMLRFFGIPVPLAGKFHSHLTISAPSTQEAERAALLVGGKITLISLQREGQQQNDLMITHHFVTGHHGLEDENDIIALLKARELQLKAVGITVHRVKLEHEMLHKYSDPLEITNSCSRIYTEVHVKCRVATDSGVSQAPAWLIDLARGLGWHPSRNPFSVSAEGVLVQFVNRRFYNTDTLKWTLEVIDQHVDTLIQALAPFLDRLQVEEIKYESAVFDSNETHDAWWMAGS